MTAPAFRLLFAQSMDAATFLAFYLFIGAGTYAERNPILLAIMAVGGIWLVAAMKVGTAMLVARRFDRPVAARAWYRPTATVLVSIGAASGIVGAGANLAAILRSI
jgi:hypothetical protein